MASCEDFLFEGQMLLHLKCGDEVAVLPTALASPVEIMRIGVVEDVDSEFVVLEDGRKYDTYDGRYWGSPDCGYIVPATDAHREWLAAKRGS